MQGKQKFTRQAMDLWAKKSSGENGLLWLPLLTHLTDTMLVITQLYNTWLSPGQRQIIEKDLGEDEAFKIVRFLGFIHDLGKATPAFQTKPSYVNSPDLDAELVEKLVRDGFEELDQVILSSRSKSPHALAGEVLLNSWGVPDSVAAIVGGHHGKPLNANMSKDLKHHTSNYWQKDRDEQKQLPWKHVQEEILNTAIQSAEYASIAEIPEVTQPQAVILSGLLIMADWLASSESMNDKAQTPLFPLIPLEKGFADIDEENRFERAWRVWQQSFSWVPEPLTPSIEPFEERWGFRGRPIQQQVVQMLQSSTDPGILIVEAPMGVGKTELALVATEILANRQGRKGIFFALPTQATSNGIFPRILDWVKFLSQRNHTTLPIKLMHARAQFNENFNSIPHASLVGQDQGVFINDWFSGKKTILDDFEVGTIDNILQASLKQKHLALKHLGLSGKVVIADEVHAYDVYMDQYFMETIKWLGAYNVPVIILSATLPAQKRADLIKNYYTGKFGASDRRGRHLNENAPTDWQTNTAYPLVTLLDGKNLIQQINDGVAEGQSDTVVETIYLNDDDELLLGKVEEELSEGGVAGVVVNTVAHAQMLAESLSQDIERIVLHSAFTTADRGNFETELQAKIGKNGNRPDKLVVIGTQVLEQSLDIDFDILFTEIAPIDLLIQRIGRLHRHDIERPKRLANPRVYITGRNGPGEYSDGTTAVYGQYLLQKTEEILPPKIRLPSDISPLVQAVYRSEENSSPSLLQAKKEFDVEQDDKRARAKQYRIRDPYLKSEKTIHGWLERPQTNADTDEQVAQAAVRDIEESIEVLLIFRNEQGDYQLPNRDLISKENVNVTAKNIAGQIIRLPVRLTRFRLDSIIRDLEKQTAAAFPYWQDNYWLRGSLALILSSEGQTELNGYNIAYSHDLGLQFTKKEGDDD